MLFHFLSLVAAPEESASQSASVELISYAVTPTGREMKSALEEELHLHAGQVNDVVVL